MRYQFNITLTEEDYLAFNNFHSFESHHSKKAIRKARLSYLAAMGILAAIAVLITGFSMLSLLYLGLVASFSLVYMLMFKKILLNNMKNQIKRMKKTGRLPYEAVSTMEFYEDRMAEISPTSRTEESYAVLERLCIVKDRYIFLYRSSISAYILPIAQIQDQVNMEDLITFLSQKCKTTEHY